VKGYLVRRLLQGVLTLFCVITLTFFLLQLTGDPTATLVAPDASQEDVATVRRQFGLDQPVLVQYVKFLAGIPRGDLGWSFHQNEPAASLVLVRLPATMLLTSTALLLALILSVPLGLIAARYQGSVLDYVVSVLSFLGFAVPTFWLGTVTILLFAVKLRLLPTSGYGSLSHLVLPATTLAFWAFGQLTLVIVTDVRGVLNQDYVRTARAKGVSESQVVLVHAFKNARIGLTTLTGLTFGPLLAGAIVTETVFAWPGLGRLLVGAILNRDFPIVRAGVVYVGVLIVLVNLIIDSVYTFLDPRIRLS
jgi:peptide/nickel transport system permease protein